MSAIESNNNQRLSGHQVFTDINAFSDLKKQARDDPKSALRPVAEQFESIFVQEIMKESRKIQLDDGFMDGDQSDFYKSWHDQQLSQHISAKGSLGFADKIVEQLAPKSLPMTQSELEAYQEKLMQRQQDAMNPSSKPVSTEQILGLRALK